MASEEHLRLANIIKDCHKTLRNSSEKYGFKKAWEEHLNNTVSLKCYAEAMHKLANIWEQNTENKTLMARSRITWTINYCTSYFYIEQIYLRKRHREVRLLKSWRIFDSNQCQYMEYIPQKLNILDVGSCFNPFGQNLQYNVTAIDLYPATSDVLKGDIFQIEIKEMDIPRIDICCENNIVRYLPKNFYECVVFSLLLEYIPTSEQRVICCRKAYDLLRFEGILIIITPDSQPVGKNAMIMKNWQYALGCLGFMRICFDKLPHITCMVFRKTCDSRVATCWARLHKQSCMNLSLEIAQDNKKD